MRPRTSPTKRKSPRSVPDRQGWIPLRSGLLVITLLSLALALWTGWQVTRVDGLGQGLLWGGITGGSIWVVFLVAYTLNRWLTRR